MFAGERHSYDLGYSNSVDDVMAFPVSRLINEALALCGILAGSSESLSDPSSKQARSLFVLNALLQRLHKRTLIPLSEWVIRPLDEEDIDVPLVDLTTDMELIFSLYYIQFLVVALADSLIRSPMGQGLEYPTTLRSTYLELYKEVSMLASPKTNQRNVFVINGSV